MNILLVLSIMISLVFSSGLLSAQGLILGHPLEFWNSADIILDGVVISTEPIEADHLIQHDVMVGQYFKNPKSQKTITVYGPDAYNEDWFYPKSFKEGERALFYLKKVDDKYIILEHSIAATEKCNPRDMIGLLTLPEESADEEDRAPFFDPYQTCNGYLYSVEYLASSLMPLKQFKAGIKIEDIKCKEGLQVVVKSSSGYPVCVKENSIVNLIERGWAKPI